MSEPAGSVGFGSSPPGAPGPARVSDPGNPAATALSLPCVRRFPCRCLGPAGPFSEHSTTHTRPSAAAESDRQTVLTEMPTIGEKSK